MGALKDDGEAFRLLAGKYLDEFANSTEEELRQVLEGAGEEAVKYLKKNSPKKTGRYARGWRSEPEAVSGAVGFYVRVYQKLRPGLTHLLELGHRSFINGKDQKRQVRAHPHIEPAHQVAAEYIDKKISELSRKG